MAKVKKFGYKNPSKRSKQFCDELKQGGGVNSRTGEVYELTDSQKTFRAGYMLARQDSNECYKKSQEYKKQQKAEKRAAKKAEKVRG